MEEQSGILDRQLDDHRAPDEQLRDLRRATGQITRAGNDAVQAYRRVSTALREESERPDADAAEIARATLEVASARAEMLAALEVASRRYPWAAPWSETAQPDGEAAQPDGE